MPRLRPASTWFVRTRESMGSEGNIVTENTISHESAKFGPSVVNALFKEYFPRNMSYLFRLSFWQSLDQNLTIMDHGILWRYFSISAVVGWIDREIGERETILSFETAITDDGNWQPRFDKQLPSKVTVSPSPVGSVSDTTRESWATS